MEGGREKIVEQFHTILKRIKLIKISENETQLDTWIQSVRNRIVESRVLRILLDAWFDIGTYAWPSLAEHAGNPLTARCRELLPRVTWAQSNFEPKRSVHRPPSLETHDEICAPRLRQTRAKGQPISRYFAGWIHAARNLSFVYRVPLIASTFSSQFRWSDNDDTAIPHPPECN